MMPSPSTSDGRRDGLFLCTCVGCCFHDIEAEWEEDVTQGGVEEAKDEPRSLVSVLVRDKDLHTFQFGEALCTHGGLVNIEHQEAPLITVPAPEEVPSIT